MVVYGFWELFGGIFYACALCMLSLGIKHPHAVYPAAISMAALMPEVEKVMLPEPDIAAGSG